ncbi:MAG: methionine--tRNA ligase, partial [Candidatus Omnitrophica bacterium]|nr:methionine--tRNA ligase [Candidatus Omnitrophota bacterium]
WKEKKHDELKSFLYALLEGIRIVSIYLSPVIPYTALSIQRQLGLEPGSFLLKEAGWAGIESFSINKEPPLFPRIDIEQI